MLKTLINEIHNENYMAESGTLSKSQPYIVLGLIGIAIIAFTYSLNDYDIYLWDRNAITVNDEGKTVNVFLYEGLTAKSCMNESVYSYRIFIPNLVGESPWAHGIFFFPENCSSLYRFEPQLRI